MEKPDNAVMTKVVTYKGKEYPIYLTEENLQDLKFRADICKLNGHDYDYYLRVISSWVGKDWADVAKQVFDESNPELKVGLGATLNLYTDRRAMTIVEVRSPREIVVKENETRCIDYYAGEYEVLDTIAEYMGESVFTLRRNGTWVEKGQPKRHGSVTLTVGLQRHYIDPSF